MPFSSFVTVMAVNSVITLSAHDSLVLAEALLNPPAPSTRLRVAAARYQQMVEEA
jgi:uncharacterized protein (DUF1778 family)